MNVLLLPLPGTAGPEAGEEGTGAGGDGDSRGVKVILFLPLSHAAGADAAASSSSASSSSEQVPFPPHIADIFVQGEAETLRNMPPHITQPLPRPVDHQVAPSSAL